MCTSFVYRKENVLIGMNFDNNGMKYRVFANQGKGFLVSVEVNVGIHSLNLTIHERNPL